ncbi:unnamed protein product [Paramecium primaurelia]|uniref:Uncharacterized protein n=1 Tax=Paramecium primaurelia TaxID=5886 RepID=A0A8S1MKT0_PARPR|nr:unnamed protein product [Paramecium primaurelia]
MLQKPKSLLRRYDDGTLREECDRYYLRGDGQFFKKTNNNLD